MRWVSAVLDLFFPMNAVCMGCASPLGVDVDWLCEDCRSYLEPMRHVGGGRCPVCSRFSRHGFRCDACKAWPRGVLTRACFAYRYGKPVDEMIRRMKYGGVYQMTDWMASEMVLALEGSPILARDAIVAVPMHSTRLRARGYNQAQLLAEKVSALSGIPVLNALTRTRNTKQQARLSEAQRKKNVRGAFLADGRVADLRVLLIDDVLTTGSTAVGCAQALMDAGARDVQLLTFAAAD